MKYSKFLASIAAAAMLSGCGKNEEYSNVPRSSTLTVQTDIINTDHHTGLPIEAALYVTGDKLNMGSKYRLPDRDYKIELIDESKEDGRYAPDGKLDLAIISPYESDSTKPNWRILAKRLSDKGEIIITQLPNSSSIPDTAYNDNPRMLNVVATRCRPYIEKALDTNKPKRNGN